MNRQIGLKLAVSSFAVLATMAGCKSAVDAGHPAFASRAAANDARQAAEANGHALAAFRAGNPAGGLAFAEQAVALAPRDAGYRTVLADLYLRNGRFQSAEAAYRDSLTLNPGDRHAELSLVLCEIANGRSAVAVATLDSLTDVPPADLGLAYALAGQPRRAIALLEPAAQASGAGGRIRQNLAFAYALAGDWQKARMIAAQDISPADLGPRLAQWAALARPSAPSDQVSALLGVRAAADSGLPERLALAAAAPAAALAAADPVPAPAAAPVQTASAEPAPAPPAAPEPQAQSAPQPAQAAPAAPVRVASAGSDVPAWVAAVRASHDRPATAPVRHPVLLRNASLDRSAAPGFGGIAGHDAGRFAVQLGAFHSPSALERAWASMLHRFAFADKVPVSTTVAIPGRGTFHRLSVAGFDSRGEASRTCGSIRAKGGACFVRAVAGDSVPQWASRYTSRKLAVAVSAH